MPAPSPRIGSDSLRLRAGRSAPVEVLYWTDGDSTFVIATGAPPAWFSAATSGVPVTLERPGEAPAPHVGRRIVGPDEIAKIERGFESKYGPRTWSRYFQGERRVIRFTRGSGATTPPSEQRIRDEFDAAARWYHERVAGDPVESELRHRSVAWLRRRLHGRDPLLEIGPGSGLETIPLLAAGHRIVSVDLSPVMLSELVQRVRSAGGSDRWEGRVGRLGTIGADLADVSDGYFAGAFSTFGAFNLEQDLAGAGEGLRRLLAPGAPLLVGTLSPAGVAPVAYAVAQRSAREIRARLSNPIPAGETRYDLDVIPRAPRALATSLGPGFRLRRVGSASVLLPPQDYPGLRRRLGAVGWQRMVDLDRSLIRLPGAGWCSEWALVELERVSTGAPGGLL